MIANVIGVHKSTISRELRRNRGYQYKQALSSVPPPGCRMRRCFWLWIIAGRTGVISCEAQPTSHILVLSFLDNVPAI